MAKKRVHGQVDVEFEWHGGRVTRRIKQATALGINKVMAESVVFALNNHPGWQYRTGIAEGSIDIKAFATEKKLFGLWGSVWTTAKKVAKKKSTKLYDTNYVWYLEFYRGHFLRRAADEETPKLGKHVRNILTAMRFIK